MCTIGLRYAQRNSGLRRDRNLHRVLDDRTKVLLRQATEAELSLGLLVLSSSTEASRPVKAVVPDAPR